MGLGEGIRNAAFRQDDDGTMDCGSEPEDVSMPPKCTPLAGKGKVVNIILARLNGALCYVSRTIGPTGPQLPHSMPVDADIIFDMIDDFYEHGVVFSGNDGWTGEISVDGDDGFG